jgi:L-2,4-diaminobutyrate decarboxylase
MSVDDLYDPERFRALGHRMVDLLADHLRDVARGPVMPWIAPEEAVAAWPPRFEGGADVVALVGRALAGSIRLHHPRYVGHQVTAPLPEAALVEVASALANNGMAVYEMGAIGVATEQAVVRWMAGALGFPAGADGVLTSGGSLGNLTALLAMRGVQGPGAILVGESAHYSVARAAAIMGCAALPVAVDARGRLRAEALPEALERAGSPVIGVAASACSTATGVFDPLVEVADFCERRGLWMHVDGAHGAAAAIAPRYRHLVAGIERADSVVWDGHKMLLLPALVTAVLFRDGRRSYAPFAQEAHYLYEGRPEDHPWDLGTRTLECTKRMMGLGAYAALSSMGPERLGAYVEGRFDLARRFAGLLREAGDFEVVEPDCNIVCFRHRPAGVDGVELDERQARARQRLIEGGGFYLVKTRLHGAVWLRVTIINPLTREADLRALIDAIRAA